MAMIGRKSESSMDSTKIKNGPWILPLPPNLAFLVYKTTVATRPGKRLQFANWKITIFYW